MSRLSRASAAAVQELVLPTVPGACLSANSRAHWATKRRENQRIHWIVRAEAMHRNMPMVSGPQRIEIEIVWPASKPGKLPDRDNAQHYAKSLVDGLKGVVLPEDDPRWVTDVRVDVRKGEEGPQTVIRLLGPREG